MKIILTERQRLILESDANNWGCDLFDNNSEQKDWCKCSMGRITNPKYKNTIKSELDKVSKFMKSETDLSERIKFYSEEDPFFSENIFNLNKLQELLPTDCSKAKNTIEEFKKELAEQFLFVDKEQDKITYSLLNKLNTNYSALSYILTNFRDRKQMKNMSFDDIFNAYFKPVIKYRNDAEETLESNFVNLLINFFSNRPEANEIIDNVLKTIRGTDDIGKRTEMEAHDWLVKTFGQNNVINFSGDFSWVDFLGVDMLVYTTKGSEKLTGEEVPIGKWVPVQIKTNVEKCVPNDRFCKNVCIGKKNGKWEVRKYT